MAKKESLRVPQTRQRVIIMTLVAAVCLILLTLLSLTSFANQGLVFAGASESASVTNEVYYIGYGESWLRRFVWSGASWVRQDVANVGSVSNFRAKAIVIGNARNDGLNRVYVATNQIRELSNELESRFGTHHVTIQVEPSDEGTDPCPQAAEDAI